MIAADHPLEGWSVLARIASQPHFGGARRGLEGRGRVETGDWASERLGRREEALKGGFTYLSEPGLRGGRVVPLGS